MSSAPISPKPSTTEDMPTTGYETKPKTSFWTPNRAIAAAVLVTLIIGGGVSGGLLAFTALGLGELLGTVGAAVVVTALTSGALANRKIQQLKEPDYSFFVPGKYYDPTDDVYKSHPSSLGSSTLKPPSETEEKSAHETYSTQEQHTLTNQQDRLINLREQLQDLTVKNFFDNHEKSSISKDVQELLDKIEKGKITYKEVGKLDEKVAKLEARYEKLSNKYPENPLPTSTGLDDDE